MMLVLAGGAGDSAPISCCFDVVFGGLAAAAFAVFVSPGGDADFVRPGPPAGCAGLLADATDLVFGADVSAELRGSLA